MKARDRLSLSRKERERLKKCRQKIARYERAEVQARSEACSNVGPSADPESAAANPQPGTSRTAQEGSHPVVSAEGKGVHPASSTKGEAKPNLSDRLKRIRSEEEEANAPKKQKGAPQKSPGAKVGSDPSTSAGVSNAQKPSGGILSNADPNLCMAPSEDLRGKRASKW